MSVKDKTKGEHGAVLGESKSLGHGESSGSSNAPATVVDITSWLCLVLFLYQCALWCPFRTLGPQTGSLWLLYSWRYVLWQTLRPTAVMSWFRSGVQRTWTVMPWLPPCQRV